MAEQPDPERATTLLRLRKASVKTTFTNTRRHLLTALDEDSSSKEEIKSYLVALEHAVAEVLDVVNQLVATSAGTHLKKLADEALDLEDLYARAVNRASEVLACMSGYQSANTSVCGVRYSREYGKVRRYLNSMVLESFERDINPSMQHSTEHEVEGPRTPDGHVDGVPFASTDFGGDRLSVEPERDGNGRRHVERDVKLEVHSNENDVPVSDATDIVKSFVATSLAAPGLSASTAQGGAQYE